MHNPFFLSTGDYGNLLNRYIAVKYAHSNRVHCKALSIVKGHIHPHSITPLQSKPKAKIMSISLNLI